MLLNSDSPRTRLRKNIDRRRKTNKVQSQDREKVDISDYIFLNDYLSRLERGYILGWKMELTFFSSTNSSCVTFKGGPMLHTSVRNVY